MDIVIDNKPKYTRDFIEYLISIIPVYFKQILDKNKLIKFDSIDILSETELTTYEVLLQSLNFINYDIYHDMIRIYIDENQKLPATDVTLKSICKLVNYGSLDYAPYPIFDLLSIYIANHVDLIYSLYKYNGGN